MSEKDRRFLCEIPTRELKNDLAETVSDIKVCEIAVLHGIKEYSGGSTKARLETNKKIKRIIESELERRNNASETDGKK